MPATTAIPSICGAPRALIGVLHLPALPGTAKAQLRLEAVVESVLAEARQYQAAGFQGLMIENMHDRPYLKGTVGPEVVAAMAVVGREVRRVAGLPLGVQVLAGANREALAVALACGAAFVRVEGFVFAHVADEGIIESTAGDLLRYRRAIGAEGVRVFADVKKKHSSHALTADVSLAETARAAEFFLADGVIVTGTSTGRPADPLEVKAVRDAAADGFIVGSWVKEDGLWSNPLDPGRLEALVRAFSALPEP